MKIFKELPELYSLKHITRYNNLPRIKDESVAEHSYFVTLIVARLLASYKFDLGKALLMATVHDIFEVYIGDTTRDVKNRFPKLDSVMLEVEEQAIEEKYPEYKSILEEFNSGSSVEGLIVKLADNLSVLQYAETEVKLGNTFYMPTVVIEAKAEIEKLKWKLKNYER